MANWSNEAEAREQIKALVAEYYHDFKEKKADFKPGDRVTYASRVFDEKEMCALTDATLDFWLTTGRFADEFEKEFAKWSGVKFANLVNSGSSANLIAFMALTAPELGDRQIKKGDEVITVACGFPTTVTPALQYGAVPVFVDVTVPQYNIDVTKLEAALSPKTKAVMIAHTLGNPRLTCPPSKPSAMPITSGWWRITAMPWAPSTPSTAKPALPEPGAISAPPASTRRTT